MLTVSNIFEYIIHDYYQPQTGVIGRSFQKMRRRLTVTGSSSTIDGSVKPGVEPSGDLKKYKGVISSKDQVGILILDVLFL